LILNFVPNQFYCLAGYWIEKVDPGKLQTFFFEKSKQRINQYENIKEEVDEFFQDINSDYKYRQKKIKVFF